MKPQILIAPACFKGSLSAAEVAEEMRAFLAERLPPGQVELRVCPIADGGDDTLALLQHANLGYQVHSYNVTGPLPHLQTTAQYLVNPGQNTAFIESAQAHGLQRMPPGQPLAPLQATSYGVGQLMRHVLETHQPETLVVSVGGSASTDGGVGALQALGLQCRDEAGQCIETPLGGGDLQRVSGLAWPAQWAGPTWGRLVIATDVVNPLLGETGTAAVFAPQKGASPNDCRKLEAGLRHVSHLMGQLASSMQAEDVTDEALVTLPGTGAAGGLAYGLRCLPRSGIVSGSQWVADQLNLPQRVAQSQLILTGEGCLDATSLGGKATGHLLAMAGNKPVFVFCGQARDSLTGWGNVSVYPLVPTTLTTIDASVLPPAEGLAHLQRQEPDAALAESMLNPRAALRRRLEAAWPTLESLISTS